MTRHDPRKATLGREYRRRQLHAELRRISRRKPIRLGCAGGGTLTYDPRPFEHRIAVTRYTMRELELQLARINRLGIAS